MVVHTITIIGCPYNNAALWSDHELFTHGKTAARGKRERLAPRVQHVTVSISQKVGQICDFYRPNYKISEEIFHRGTS